MLIDSTLREGAQAYGVAFSQADRRAVLCGLARLGADEAECGCVGQEELPGLVAWARGALPGLRLGVWCPAREDDLARAARLGADVVNIGLPVSDAHLVKRLRLTREELLERLSRLLVIARSLGIPRLSVGLEDASRADGGFVLEAAAMAAATGAWRLRLSDTVGILAPREMATLVERLRGRVDLPLAVHCHDDFGMATANAVSALGAGASFADVSVLGIGERSGIAKTEEVAAYLALRACSGRYDLTALPALAARVGRVAGAAPGRLKAVVGRDIFACETGLHVHGLRKDPTLYEPYPPVAVGACRVLAVGAKSGRAAVAAAAAELGRDVPEKYLDDLVRAVRAMGRSLGRPLTAGEFGDLCP